MESRGNDLTKSEVTRLAKSLALMDFCNWKAFLVDGDIHIVESVGSWGDNDGIGMADLVRRVKAEKLRFYLIGRVRQSFMDVILKAVFQSESNNSITFRKTRGLKLGFIECFLSILDRNGVYRNSMGTAKSPQDALIASLVKYYNPEFKLIS